jgi:hypothetical protein
MEKGASVATKYVGLIGVVFFSLLCVAPMTQAQEAQVRLAWDPPNYSVNDMPVVALAGYKLYYWQQHWEVPASIDVGSKTAFTLTHLETGQPYTFAATTYNIAGDESVFSNHLTLTFPLLDTDGDGLPDVVEQIVGTDPTLADTDGDGLSDGDETQDYGTDPLDADSDGDGVNDAAEIVAGTSPHDPSLFPSIPHVESGDVIAKHTWQRVTFQQPFVDPIVVATSLSKNGSNPAVVRLQNVSPTGFDIRVQEWDYLDGFHMLETAGYIVLERGSYTLPDGTRVEAGQFETTLTAAFQSVEFVQPFDTAPVVLTAITSINGTDTVTGRVRQVGRHSFEFQMQEQEHNAPTHSAEMISYIAWEPSAGTLDGDTCEVATTPDSITHRWEPLQFLSFFDTPPVFVAATQTVMGSNTAAIRWRNKDAFGVDIMIQEEGSHDAEMLHNPEAVGYIACTPTAQ